MDVFFVLDKYENASIFQRLTLIDNEFPGAAVLLHKHGVIIKVYYGTSRFCHVFTFIQD